jgi:hypothetical protein
MRFRLAWLDTCGKLDMRAVVGWEKDYLVRADVRPSSELLLLWDATKLAPGKLGARVPSQGNRGFACTA